MFIHDQKDKLLVAFGDPPVDITELQIEANKDLLSVEIKLTEKQFTASTRKTFLARNMTKERLSFNAHKNTSPTF